MIEFFKTLIQQKITIILMVVGCIIVFLSLFKLHDISKGIITPLDTPAYIQLIIGSVIILFTLGVTIFIEKKVQQSTTKDATAITPVNNSSGNIKSSSWYCEWRLGTQFYKERLRLDEHPSGEVTGQRWTEAIDKTREFRVCGFYRGGYYWLEYHDEHARGGGTLLLHEFTSGRLRGIITAANCITGELRSYANQWVQCTDSDTYDPMWLISLGKI